MEYQGIHVGNVFYVLNEWLVQNLTEKAVYLYAEADPRYNVADVKKMYATFPSYKSATFEGLIKAIAEAKQMSAEEVYKELYKGLFEGKDLFDDSLTRWINKIYGRDAIEKIANTKQFDVFAAFSTRDKDIINDTLSASQLVYKMKKTIQKIPKTKRKK